ncbi:hypothetical protein MLD38_028777 [Melastoma candidum]|uniref:Uncharacterized protein n=1 Tax=Melastoma candidum TaxID=119954 RepID=A0ACB9N1Q6_9MYRT|nr:hypothetical protein MLD38_028777 [Melastoma candidum]
MLTGHDMTHSFSIPFTSSSSSVKPTSLFLPFHSSSKPLPVFAAAAAALPPSDNGPSFAFATVTSILHDPSIEVDAVAEAELRENGGDLVCPVRDAAWKDVPLLRGIRRKDEDNCDVEDKKMVETTSSPPMVKPAKFYPEPCSPHLTSPRLYGDDEPLVLPKTCRESRKGLKAAESETFLISVGPIHTTYAIGLIVKAPPPASSMQSSTQVHVLDPSRRAPINLVATLDVDGSITGAKMQMMKRLYDLAWPTVSHCQGGGGSIEALRHAAKVLKIGGKGIKLRAWSCYPTVTPKEAMGGLERTTLVPRLHGVRS